MPTFNLLIATPEEVVFEGEVRSAIFPGTEGFFEILANHAAMITTVKEGTIAITDKEHKRHSVESQAGFLTVFQNRVVLLKG